MRYGNSDFFDKQHCQRATQPARRRQCYKQISKFKINFTYWHIDCSTVCISQVKLLYFAVSLRSMLCKLYTISIMHYSTQLLLKHVNRCNFQSNIRHVRSFSVFNKSREHGICNAHSIDHDKFRKNMIVSSYLHNRRYLSLEGFAKWQEQTYSSISNSYPVHVIQDGLLYFHDITGLSWWATVVTSTVLIRLIMTLPLSIYQNQILAKVESIGIELKDMVNEMKRETAIAKKKYKLTDKQAVNLYKISMKKQWVKLIERDNCHPFKSSLLIWFQLPFWVCMSFALRNLVYVTSGDPSALVTLMELSTGGIGWIPNLTEPDHSLILPIAFGLTNLTIIEIQRLSKLREPSRIYNVFTNVFRVFSIVMIPVAATVPSCMCLYWMTSSSVGLVQNLVLLSPKLRRKLRIPEVPSELEDPYNHIRNEVKQKLSKILPK